MFLLWLDAAAAAFQAAAAAVGHRGCDGDDGAGGRALNADGSKQEEEERGEEKEDATMHYYKQSEKRRPREETQSFKTVVFSPLASFLGNRHFFERSQICEKKEILFSLGRFAPPHFFGVVAAAEET